MKPLTVVALLLAAVYGGRIAADHESVLVVRSLAHDSLCQAARAHAHVKVSARTAGVVYGYVGDEERHAVPQAEVTVCPRAVGDESCHAAQTDSSGYFSVQLESYALNQVTVAAEGFTGASLLVGTGDFCLEAVLGRKWTPSDAGTLEAAYENAYGTLQRNLDAGLVEMGKLAKEAPAGSWEGREARNVLRAHGLDAGREP